MSTVKDGVHVLYYTPVYRCYNIPILYSGLVVYCTYGRVAKHSFCAELEFYRENWLHVYYCSSEGKRERAFLFGMISSFRDFRAFHRFTAAVKVQ